MRPPARTLANALSSIVILAAFGLRLYRLGYQELRGDEAFGYFFSLRSVSGIFRGTLALREPHPIASYLLEKSWIAVAGSSEFALRFLSMWFGVVAVALVYRLARRLALPRASALLAAALLAVSPYAVWHSQDARMYSLSLALTLASTCLAVEVVARPRLSSWLSYAVVSWLALNTHYFVAFVLLAQNAWFLGQAVLSRQPYRRLAPAWVAVQLLVALLYTPWVLAAGGIIAGYGGNGDSPAFGEMLRRALGVFAIGETAPDTLRSLAALLAAALLIWGTVLLLRSGRSGRSALALLLLYLFLPLVATWASARGRPIFNERYLIAAAPPFCLLVAVAGTGVPRAIRSSLHARDRAPARLSRARVLAAFAPAFLVAALSLAAGLSLVHLYDDPAFSKSRGWRELAAALRTASAGLPTDQVRVVQNYPDPTLWYYYPEAAQRLTLPPAPQDEAGARRLAAEWAAAGVRRVILPLQPAPAWDEHLIAASALQADYELAGQIQVAGWPVQIYVRPPERLAACSEAFEGGLTLTGKAIEPEVVVPGGFLAIHLRWDGQPATLPGGEKLTLQVLNAGGQVVAQTDRPFGPTQNQAVSGYGIALPHALPDGSYRLILALYDADRAGARLPTAEGADFVELGSLATPPTPSSPRH